MAGFKIYAIALGVFILASLGSLAHEYHGHDLMHNFHDTLHKVRDAVHHLKDDHHHFEDAVRRLKNDRHNILDKVSHKVSHALQDRTRNHHRR